jgi:hypothetical protein
MVTATVPIRATTLACPNCGSSIELHAQGWAVTVACSSCGSVLDALDPNLRVLQEHAMRLPHTPAIPLGTRGKIRGVEYEVIGCQRVAIEVEGVEYAWTEYVCFNPYHGFMYLSEYEGHWNVIEKLRRKPGAPTGSGRPAIALDGRTYHHFQTAQARTTMAMGEFPWELRVGDEVKARDFISPPFILSAEVSDQEVTWSRGEYTDPSEIAKMFGVPSIDRRPEGVFANQPNTHVRAARRVAKVGGPLMLLWFLILVATIVFSQRDEVFSETYTYDRTRGEQNALVTTPFELRGRTSNVRITIRAALENDWAFFGLALIHDGTGQARDVGKQLSFYSGRDSDGSWSEGSRTGSVTLSSVPSGRYALRLLPEGGEPVGNPVSYTVTIKRDVPAFSHFVIAFFALVVPMALVWAPVIGFESRRWMESDHEVALLNFPKDEENA